ncbi:imidazole glycerol phosphate synthase subunit HisH [soil metagenome]
MITIIDYGVGNLGSVVNMFKYIGYKTQVTSDKERILEAEKILLPGVGAFDHAMTKLNEMGLSKLLRTKADDGTPLLGICLGMQLLTKGSEEGILQGLGLIDAYSHSFKKIENELKVPHMGWNIATVNNDNPLTDNFKEELKFYFVHSYYVQVANEADSMLKTNYGVSFDSGIAKNNIYGVQFHPEKSHKFGMSLFENFAVL